MITQKQRDIYTIISLAVLGGALYVAESQLDAYSIRIMNLVAINAILALSLNLIYGFTGMFSLGHAGFMAVGAYVCTLFILTPDQKVSMWILEDIHPLFADLSLPFFLSVVLGALALLLSLFLSLYLFCVWGAII